MPRPRHKQGGGKKDGKGHGGGGKKDGGKRKRKNPLGPYKGYNAAAPGMPRGKPARALRRAANKQVQAFVGPRSGAIRGYTNQLARSLQPLAGQVGNIYEGAGQTQAGIDTNLAQGLQGNLYGAAGGVEAQLAAAGQSTHPANLVRAQALGAANAGLAVGSANQGMLAAHGASAQTYAAGMPGIARLGGIQAQRDLSAQGAAMIPGILQQQQETELNKWIARTGLGETRVQRRTEVKEAKRERRHERGMQARDIAADNVQGSSGAAKERREALRQDVRESNGDARGKAEDLYSRTKTVTEFGSKKEVPNRPKWGVAFKQVMAIYRNDLGNRITAKQRRALTRQALISAGFKPPPKPRKPGKQGVPHNQPGGPGGPAGHQ